VGKEEWVRRRSDRGLGAIMPDARTACDELLNPQFRSDAKREQNNSFPDHAAPAVSMDGRGLQVVAALIGTYLQNPQVL
jgi:hypothetical protein